MESRSTNWIWIRGLVRGKYHWYDFEEHFRKYFPENSIEMIDIPGNGERHDEISPISIAQMTDSLRESSKLRAQKDRPFLLSISMGSMIAMDWAYRYPEEVQGVVCMNTSLREQSSLFQRLKPRNYLGMIASAAQKDPVKRELLNLEMICKRRTDLKSIAEAYGEYAKKHPVSLQNVSRQLLAASTFQAPSERAKRPFLFLNSLRDTFVDPKCTERAAKWVGGDLVTHPTAGHDLPLEDGSWVAERISEWVDSLA